MQLQDSVIIITGGGQGLGRAMGEFLAAKGARLALVDLNQEALDAAVAACKQAGGDARSYICNVANEEQVTHMVNQVADDFGAIHGLINNAGILRDGLLLKAKDGQIQKMSMAQWQSVIDVNLTGVFLCGRAAVEQMVIAGDGGLIVNISSISAAGNMGQSNYSAAKAGVAAMAVTWAKEFARYGIRVNALSPGFIGTEMVRAMPEEVLNTKIISHIPVGRLGEPSEIARCVVFLASDDAGFITGSTLSANGGQYMA